MTTVAPLRKRYGLTREQWVRLVNGLTRFRQVAGYIVAAIGIFAPEHFRVPVVILIFAALLSDMEGYLARHVGAMTPEGARLDPKADGSLFVGIGIYILAQKELDLITIAEYHIPALGLTCYCLLVGRMRARGQIERTSMLAKTVVATVATAAALSLCHQTFRWWSERAEHLAVGLLWLAFGLAIIAFIKYRLEYRKRIAAEKLQ